jgi:hypothetical protein
MEILTTPGVNIWCYYITVDPETHAQCMCIAHCTVHTQAEFDLISFLFILPPDFGFNLYLIGIY